VNSDPKIVRAAFPETEQYYRTAWERNPKRPRYWLAVFVVVPLASLAVLPDALRLYREGDPQWWVGYAAMPVVLLLIWLFLLRPAAQWRLIRKNLQKKFTHSLARAQGEFSGTGIFTAGSDGATTFQPWNNVSSAVELSDGIFFYFGENQQSYCWFPRSAFGSEADYKEMLALVRDKVAKVTNQSQ
jgi:YcxB-like protein